MHLWGGAGSGGRRFGGSLCCRRRDLSPCRDEGDGGLSVGGSYRSCVVYGGLEGCCCVNFVFGGLIGMRDGEGTVSVCG